MGDCKIKKKVDKMEGDFKGEMKRADGIPM
jgi:hypothetical protein